VELICRNKPICTNARSLLSTISAAYFRCRIPNGLLSCYEDKREIIFSLKTRDHHEAMRRVSIEAGKLQTEFEALRRPLVNAQNPPKRLDYTDAEIERLSLLWTRCVLGTDDKQRIDGYSDESFDEQAERLADTEQDLKKIYARGELEKIYPALDGFLALTRTAPPDDPIAYRRLAMSFLKAVLQATKLQLARQEGEIVETELIVPADKVYVAQVTPASDKPSSRLDLSQLLQNWQGAVSHRAPSTVDAYTSAVKEFKASRHHRSRLSRSRCRRGVRIRCRQTSQNPIFPSSYSRTFRTRECRFPAFRRTLQSRRPATSVPAIVARQ